MIKMGFIYKETTENVLVTNLDNDVVDDDDLPF